MREQRAWRLPLRQLIAGAVVLYLVLAALVYSAWAEQREAVGGGAFGSAAEEGGRGEAAAAGEGREERGREWGGYAEVKADGELAPPQPAGKKVGAKVGGGKGKKGGKKADNASKGGTAAATAAVAEGAAHAVVAPLGCPGRHPRYRIAMILAWLGPPPAWFSHFALSCARSAHLVDWLVFHEGLLNLRPGEPAVLRPPNLLLVDLGDGGLASKFGLGMGKALGWQGTSTRMLVGAFKTLFKAHPRLLAEYKPAFGSIFEKHLRGYSHWGYTDIDIIWGEVPKFLDASELGEFDIFSWGFGDQSALYLRGQWTVFAVGRALERLWTACAHLGSGLMKEVQAKLAWEKKRKAASRSRGSSASQPRRFISAEGCYSKVVAQTPGIRALLSVKQLIGDDQRHPLVVASNGRVWSCAGDPAAVASPELAARALVVLERQANQNDHRIGDSSFDQSHQTGGNKLERLANHHAAGCEHLFAPTQRATGKLVPLAVEQQGCGSWIQPEFRLCAHAAKGEDEREWRVLLVNGSFFRQAVQSLLPRVRTEEGAGGLACTESAFFHFQEWKKAWPSAIWHALGPTEQAADVPSSDGLAHGLLLNKKSVERF